MVARTRLAAPALVVLALGGCTAVPAPPEPATVAIIPAPVSLEVDEGAAPFVIDARTAVLFDADMDGAVAAAALLVDLLRLAVPGIAGPIAHPGGEPAEGAILLAADASLPDEGYRLSVTVGGVTLYAADARGLVWGVQTLRQLLPPRAEGNDAEGGAVAVAAVMIEDAPRFGWRGLMLDVSRTFFPLSYVLRMIDLASLYKINVFHLHLSDDQGFRMESLTHPELHTAGSVWDAELAPGEVGGYYTQAELRRLVAHAAARGVEVVPELDMPGHSLAILRAMPELACATAPDQPRTREDFRIVPYTEGPRIHSEVLCVCDERVYEVMTDLVDELGSIFRSPFVHLGGDETPTSEWANGYLCQELIAEGALGDIGEAQAYFARRMEDVLRARGKRMIGWTEVVANEPADDPPDERDWRLSPDFTTMHWLGLTGDPPRLYDRDVILSPMFEYYLDWYTTTDLRGVYAYDPIREGLDDDERARIVGIQGNMWTGFPQNRTEERVDLHVFPKLLAIAERAWSPPELIDRVDFEERLRSHAERLEALGVAQGTCPEEDCPL